jgi:predicted O-linked N-acetylglucosamine transferase (SPINDLY family)
MGRFQEALQIAETLSARQVNEWQVYASLGEALAGLKRFAEAREAFTDARRLGAKYHRDGRFNDKPLDAVTEDVDPRAVYLGFEIERLARCEWADYQTKIASIRKLTEDLLAEGAHTPLTPFNSLSLPLPPSLQLAIARNEANYIKAGMAEIKRSQGFIPVRRPVDRLRIGYVSADFRYHPTAHLMRSLFKIHDRRGFEIYGYALNKEDGSRYYSQIKADCDHFIDLTELSNAQAAQRIYEDGIHILVDLMGYTKYARTEIFALQPAPIQVSYLGFPGTLGADFIHYILADSTVLPAEQAEFFTEQPVYLPDCYQVNDRWQEIAETGISRADQGLPEKGFVFCCFNQANKLDPVMFAVWVRILKELPGSVLWLLLTRAEMQDNLRREAEAHGVAGERLIFAKHLPKDRHLERHRLADLFLDTRLYNAHTTASDALWAGLPVLTCRGQAFAARVGASLLQAVGLPQLITENLKEYHRLAIHLATQPQELLELRNRLLKNRLSTPLFDTERFVRHLEQGYRIMWARYQRAEEPQAIRVTPLAPADSSEPMKRANFRLWPWKLGRSR